MTNMSVHQNARGENFPSHPSAPIAHHFLGCPWSSESWRHLRLLLHHVRNFRRAPPNVQRPFYPNSKAGTIAHRIAEGFSFSFGSLLATSHPLSRPFTLVPETSPSPKNQRYFSDATFHRSLSHTTILYRNVTLATPETSLPSPVTSTFDAVELPSPVHCTDSDSEAVPTLNRKRRLSDPADDLPNPKRPQTSSAASQLNTASYSLPVFRHATASEFQWDQLLDFSRLPPPVSDLDTEIMGPVDVSLFEFSAWDDFAYDTMGLNQGQCSTHGSPQVEIDAPIPGSSNMVDTDVTGGFAARSTEALADGKFMTLSKLTLR